MNKSLRQVFLSLALSAVMVASAYAAGAGAFDKKMSFNIDAQPVMDALMKFSEQSGIQVAFATQDAKGILAHAVAGELTPAAALDALLGGSGLRYEFMNDNRIVTIRAGVQKAEGVSASAGSAEAIRLTQVDEPSSPEAQEQDRDINEQARSGQNVRTDRGIPEILVKGSRGRSSLNADIQRTEDDARPYVILDRAKIEKSTARNLNEFLLQELPMQNAGGNFDNLVPGDRGQNNGESALEGGSRVTLRGLSSRETLILIDGRRATMRLNSWGAQSETQADINGIPLAAVERIEVLPASASGIYGGNATGGVINIVLRRDYKGVQASVNYRDTFAGGGAMRGADIYGGFDLLGSTSVQFSGSYASVSSLRAGDVGYVSEYRKRFQEDQLYPGRTSDVGDTRSNYFFAVAPLGAATNIGAWDGVSNLTFKPGNPSFPNVDIGSPITSVPVGYAGLQSDDGASLLAGAGRYNLDLAQNSTQSSGGEDADLIGGSRMGSAEMSFRTQWSRRVESFLSAGFSRNETRFRTQTPAEVFVLPGSSSANPFNEEIMVVAPLRNQIDGGLEINRADTGNILLGMNLKLSDNWTSSLEYRYSSVEGEKSDSSLQFGDQAYTDIPNGVVNLLQDPSGYSSLLFSDYLVPVRESIDPQHSRLGTFTLRAAGPLLHTPAGAINISTNVSADDQTYSRLRYRRIINNTDVFSDYLRTSSRARSHSAYTEITLPFISESAPLLGFRSAELQLAGRYDRYELLASQSINMNFPPETIPAQRSRTFSKTVPSLNLRVEPLRNLILRASYNEGFLPPYLGQLQDNLNNVYAAVPFFLDPRRGNTPVGQNNRLDGNGSPLPRNNEILFTDVGNGSLNPELSEAWSAGVILKPHGFDGLRVSIDWVRIEKTGNIFLNQAGFQSYYDNEGYFPGTIIRGPLTPEDEALGYTGGPILAVLNGYRNGLRSLSETYDFAVDYALPFRSIGEWSASARATKTLHSSFQRSAAAQNEENSDSQMAPRWAGNLQLNWVYRDLSASLFGRYLDGFNVYNDMDSFFGQLFAMTYGKSRVSSRQYFDLSISYNNINFDRNRGNFGSTVFSDVNVRFGIKNILNAKPRYGAFGVGSGFGAPYLAQDDLMGISYLISLQVNLGN